MKSINSYHGHGWHLELMMKMRRSIEQETWEKGRRRSGGEGRARGRVEKES